MHVMECQLGLLSDLFSIGRPHNATVDGAMPPITDIGRSTATSKVVRDYQFKSFTISPSVARVPLGGIDIYPTQVYILPVESQKLFIGHRQIYLQDSGLIELGCGYTHRML